MHLPVREIRHSQIKHEGYTHTHARAQQFTSDSTTDIKLTFESISETSGQNWAPRREHSSMLLAFELHYPRNAKLSPLTILKRNIASEYSSTPHSTHFF